MSAKRLQSITRWRLTKWRFLQLQWDVPSFIQFSGITTDDSLWDTKEWGAVSVVFGKKYFGSERIRREVKDIMKGERGSIKLRGSYKKRGEQGDINQIAWARIRFFLPFPHSQSDSCLTESDKAEGSSWRQAPQNEVRQFNSRNCRRVWCVDFSLPAFKIKRWPLLYIS